MDFHAEDEFNEDTFILDLYFAELQRFWTIEKQMKASAASGEVVELRQQLRQLTSELQNLRTNLRGSVPDFMDQIGVQDLDPKPKQSKDDFFSSFLPSITSPIKTPPTKIFVKDFQTIINNGKEKTDVQESPEKPPLPPRLYRPPQKPQRTFAQQETSSSSNLITDLSRVLHDIDQGNNHSLSGCPKIASSMPVFGGLRRPNSKDNGWKFQGSTMFPPQDQILLNSTFRDVSTFHPPPPPPHFNSRGRRYASNGSLNQNMNPPPLPPKNLRNSPSSLRVSMPQIQPQNNLRGTRLFQSIRENSSGMIGSGVSGPGISGPHLTDQTRFDPQRPSPIRPSPQSPFAPYKPSTIEKPKSNVVVESKSLTHMSPPITLNSVVREIKENFEMGTCWFSLGPVTLFLNPFNDMGSNVTLSSVRDCPQPLINVTKRVHEEFKQAETSQSVVISGISSSGKSYVTMQMLRQIYIQFGGRGSRESPAFTTLAAATTVLRSLTCAQMRVHEGASQTALLYEVHICDDLPAKTKLYCCFTDLSRLTKSRTSHSNFNIFYEMLAGLSYEEKVKFHLNNASESNVYYLQCGDSKRDPSRDQQRFIEWTHCLSALGIPFSDVLRLLAAVILLGNVQFSEGEDGDLEMGMGGQKDLESVAALLGVSSLSLYKTFTRKVKQVKGHQTSVDKCADAANRCRDALSESLYYRCISAIVRRANSIKCGACNFGGSSSNGGISSSDGESSSVQDSGIGLTRGSPEESPTNGGGQLDSSKNSSGRSTEGVISVLDMFAGASEEKYCRFDDFCKQIAVEKMQQFYQQTLFEKNKQLIISEGIESTLDDADFTFSNNFLDLCYSPICGLLPILDSQTLDPIGNVDLLIEGVKTNCQEHGCVKFASSSTTNPHNLIINHYGHKSIEYDTNSFLTTNADNLPAEVARIFAKGNCNFGFASYFFSNDLKAMESESTKDGLQKQTSLRIMGSCGAENSSNFDGGATLMQDFTNQCDFFIKALATSKVHFVHCVKPNEKCEYRKFEETTVKEQIKSLDVLPTMNLVGQGFPYHKSIISFNNRYRFLAVKYHHELDFESNNIEETKLIFDCYLRAVDESDLPYVTNQWALGISHVFLSQGAYEQLETFKKMFEKGESRMIPANLFDETVPNINSWLQQQKSTSPEIRDRPKPVVDISTCDQVLKKASSLLGIDLNSTSAPPLPATRQYFVNGEKKLNFPQRRILAESYKDPINAVHLKSGEIITAIGCASKPKHILIDLGGGKVVPIPTAITRLST